MTRSDAPSENPAAGYALAVVGSLIAVGLAAAAERWLGLNELSMVFVLAVLIVAARSRTGPAVLTALLCFLGYNFFFIEPRYTLYVDASQVATITLFFAVALLTGRLASRLAMQVEALRVANRNSQTRQELGRRLSVARDESEVVAAATDAFRESLDALVWIRLGERELPCEGVEAPILPALRRIDGPLGTAETVEEHGWWFLPLRAPQGALGVIGIKRSAERAPLDERQRALARTMIDDVAQALLRTHLVADLQSERVANETERLRNALLASVSHDLRTPLAAIIGAAGSLDSYGAAMNEADRHALLDTVRSEGERLDRYIQNLLDMTRLGHGTLALHRDWIGIDELIGSATARLQRYQPQARFAISVANDIGPIWVHPALIEQALFNVIENAIKFSPADEPVTIEATRRDGRLNIDVRDRGPGIPPTERQRIFERFYSIERGDRGKHGTGLGLAICRGMIGAHGGEVEAQHGPDGHGTSIRITLPLHDPPPARRDD